MNIVIQHMDVCMFSFLLLRVMSMVVPVYNAEVSPKDIRGRLVSLQQLSITAGIMVNLRLATDLRL